MVIFDDTQKLIRAQFPGTFLEVYCPGLMCPVRPSFQRPSVLEFVLSAQANLGSNMRFSVASALTVSELGELVCVLNSERQPELKVPKELRKGVKELQSVAQGVECFFYEVLHQLNVGREQTAALLRSDREILANLYGKTIIPQNDGAISATAKRQKNFIFDAYQEGFPQPRFLTASELQEAVSQVSAIQYGRMPIPAGVQRDFFTPDKLTARVKEYESEQNTRYWNAGLNTDSVMRVTIYNNRVLDVRRKDRARKERVLADLASLPPMMH